MNAGNQTVAVVVPTFNRAAMLRECLQSLLAQTRPLDQIIVVDDGSSDETATVVREAGVRVTYLRQDNGGKARALNHALPLVTSEWCWLFDDDDVALPHSVERRIAALASNPRASFVVSNHWWGDASGVPVDPPSKAKWPRVDGDFFSHLLRGCFVTLQGALVRTACYRAVGPFDESLETSEDYDMLLRLARDYTPVLLDEPTFIFRQHDGLRGQATGRYSAAEREMRFARQDGRIGRRLRAELPLGDYLRPRRTGPLTALQRRQALIGRIGVMASKGLGDELLQDARELALIPAPLIEAEQQALVQAFQHRYLVLALTADRRGFLRDARALASTPQGRAVLRCFARGALGLARWSAERGAERRAIVATAVQLASLSWFGLQWPMAQRA